MSFRFKYQPIKVSRPSPALLGKRQGQAIRPRPLLVITVIGPTGLAQADGGVLLVMAVGDRAQLAVLGTAGCDLGQIGYETAMLAHRVSSALEPGARVAGQL